MLKKAGIVATAAAGIMLIGAPAFASGYSEQGASPDNGQIGLVNLQNIDILHNVNAVLGACGNDVAVLGAVLPIGSPNASEDCASGAIVNVKGHDHGHHHHHHHGYGDW